MHRSLVDRSRPWALLALGFVLVLSTGPRWGIGLLAWLTPVPFLAYARGARGVRAWAAMFGVMLVGYALQYVPLATPPVPIIALIGFGPPLALVRFGAVGVAELARRRLGEGAAVLAFVLGTVVFDWVGYGATELGDWMATATSQSEATTLLQVTALAGVAGLGALMAWTAGTLTTWLAAPRAASPKATLALGATLLATLVWGTFRLDAPLPGRSVAVAAVVTTVGPGEDGMPDAPALAANTDALFAKTHVAAARGARLVVWNEVATLVEPNDEAAFLERGRATARELGIDLVLAYAVLETRTPPWLDNKYVFVSDAGEILDTYQKHHPVPGEPSIRGTGPIRVLDRPYGKVGGAICYDYDFPSVARAHAREVAELVVLPSSDWRGIDPVHTSMARVRAVEGGFSLVRSVRWAASAAFDAHGRVRGWMPAIDDNDGVMVATVPVGRTPTLATALGDLPVALAAALLVGLVAAALARRRGESRPAEAGSQPGRPSGAHA